MCIRDRNEDTGRWLVKTNLNDEIKARYVVHSNGPLNRPKLPAIKGINDYKGHTFHTSRWDYAYTGGSSHGDLSNLKDKKVAIIGTGATAVQCVPHLGASAEKLQCPRCSRTVTDKHGICKHCGDNAYQCRHCRNINYEKVSSLPPHYHLITTSLPPHYHLITTSLPPHYHLITSAATAAT